VMAKFQRVLRMSGSVLCLMLGACASKPPKPCPTSLEPVINDRLYFGLATPDGLVSSPEWDQFIDTVVTPRFPKGLTVLLADGQWQGTDGAIVREPSKVLVLVHPDSPENELAIGGLVADYKARFRQESVLRVRSVACVAY
jgi:hypothetical protein